MQGQYCNNAVGKQWNSTNGAWSWRIDLAVTRLSLHPRVVCFISLYLSFLPFPSLCSLSSMPLAYVLNRRIFVWDVWI